jgi:hypothetical protein
MAKRPPIKRFTRKEQSTKRRLLRERLQSGLFWVVGNRKTGISPTGDEFFNKLFAQIAGVLGVPKSMFPNYKMVNGALTFNTAREAYRATIIMPFQSVLQAVGDVAVAKGFPAAQIEKLKEILLEALKITAEEVATEEYNATLGKYFKLVWPPKVPKAPEPGVHRSGQDALDSQSVSSYSEEKTVATGTTGGRAAKTGTKGTETGFSINFDSNIIASIKNKRRDLLSQHHRNIHRILLQAPTTIFKKDRIILQGPSLEDLFRFSLAEGTSRSSRTNAFLILELGTGKFAKPLVFPYQSATATPFKIPPTVVDGNEGLWTNLSAIAKIARLKAGIESTYAVGSSLGKTRNLTSTDSESPKSPYAGFDLLGAKLARWGRPGIHAIFSPTKIRGYAQEMLNARDRWFRGVKQKLPGALTKELIRQLGLYEAQGVTRAKARGDSAKPLKDLYKQMKTVASTLSQSHNVKLKIQMQLKQKKRAVKKQTKTAKVIRKKGR